ncbi:hypothetical protein Q73A0000_15830 [Kaistella flava (ex Peng et al. 2021)]|uniref:Lipoprotein n=1 Tax=Kaistella flava (ex Peng et al. 2021) TaxID=2038776 RepID=A0A7M2YDL2_9FLAO|nr:hypothetical protein [Kaistella flava (ex Peng et al. 2021)]QOW11724.1 hypothetical protein Q73A0000_15830 [Kaistella flava (ex Peng et al. 2021)]
MIYRILLSSLAVFTLATCQNQNAAKTEKATIIENTKVVTTSDSTTPKKDEPKMSTGLPPDAEAVKIAEHEQANSNQKNVIYLKEGENKFFKEYGMNVTFNKIVEDSRCPKDVQCVWAGNAMAEVTLMGTYTRPVTLQLSTLNDASKGYQNTQNFNGYAISLIDVSPETTSAKGFKALKGTYKIALQFEKETDQNPSTERGGTTTK